MGLLLAVWETNPPQLSARQDAPALPSVYKQQSAEGLQQLTAPIALYPDALVAEVLAASTFPEQVVEADRWVQAHPNLKGKALGEAVDPEPWDPSVKALTAFPGVLGNMDKNLSWTSSLGDAYYNQQQDVMEAVQTMRHRAQGAGKLKSTPQQTVGTQDASISIEPASADMVYVPAYDPWTVYGGPVDAWPGWYEYPGIWFNGPYLSFGGAFGIGFFGGFSWGFPHWGFDWHNRAVLYNHSRYFSRSNTFYNRSVFGRGGFNRGGSPRGNRPFMGERGGVTNRSWAPARGFTGNAQPARGFGEIRGQSGIRSGAFSGYQHGGQTRGFSSRGSSSMGGSSMGSSSMGRGGGHGGGGGGRHR
jgi:hypothetical protein